MLLTQLCAQLIFLSLFCVNLYFLHKSIQYVRNTKMCKSNFTDRRYTSRNVLIRWVAGESEPSAHTRMISFLDIYTVHLYTGTIACRLLRNELRKNLHQPSHLSCSPSLSLFFSHLPTSSSFCFTLFFSALFHFSLHPFMFSPFLLITFSFFSLLSFFSLF